MEEVVKFNQKLLLDLDVTQNLNHKNVSFILVNHIFFFFLSPLIGIVNKTRNMLKKSSKICSWDLHIDFTWGKIAIVFYCDSVTANLSKYNKKGL